jgi:metallo-beta-lactamase family protein
MHITFYGAARTVTGSMHLLEVNGKKLLIDCGMYQGARHESNERNRYFPFSVHGIDAVLLTHAHIDHCGNLPNLIKQGFRGKIYGTYATNHLTDLMVRDSGHIQEKQAESLNYHRHKKPGEKGSIEPIYTEQDGAKVKNYLNPKNYGQEFEPIPGVRARFVDAGHILGSAAVALEVQEGSRKKRVWFSGDIGRLGLPIIRDPILPDPSDYLIMESTYGDKPHRDPEQAYIEMRAVINRTLERGGKVIIPAFAVGRTQELVYNLNLMSKNGDLPKDVPVYVDSPLAVNVTDVFRQHPECYDAETLALIQSGHPALEFEQLRYVQSVEESKSLNHEQRPMIVISAAGMAEVGRVVYHIRWSIENPKNTIMIVSWQAPQTLGRRLAEREEEVRMLGESFIRRAEVATIGGLSAHAGQNFLTDYAMTQFGHPHQIHLVHGEEKAATALMERLNERGLSRVFYPEARDVLEL